MPMQHVQKTDFGAFLLVAHQFESWNYFNYSDPTHGAVTYVDHDTAKEEGLVGLTAAGKYRQSVSLESNLSLEVNSTDGFRVNSFPSLLAFTNPRLISLVWLTTEIGPAHFAAAMEAGRASHRRFRAYAYWLRDLAGFLGVELELR